MKWAICGLCMLLSAAAYSQDTGKCYVVYTDTKDRLIMGCPVPGYHINYQMAHGTSVNMFLFRDDEDERGQVSVYFAVSTLDYDKKTFEELFHDDLAGISDRNPSFIIKTIQSATKSKLKCLFAEIEFRVPGKALPFQTMALCQSESSESALLFVMQSKDRETAGNSESSFIAWIDTHKLFRADVKTDPRGSSGGIGVK